ncbi:respiratory nitrate reductase subunit gamma [Nonomuraea sp. NPDC050310]|uniref:respiratory nitrate reductase subunit gamma n=1 Tax=Nonomuraea sp. NPDC050310 TaxID=3154935 RepID=UPI0033C1CE4E
MSTLLWVILPYVVIVVLAGGLVWRYRYDRFGWTTRSSELYESRLLRIGSPLFHFGLIFVILGHVLGLLIPESWTRALGVTDPAYHAVALVVGGIAGFCTLAGLAILIYRRRTTRAIFRATTRNDKLMFVVLVAALVAGLAATVLSTVDHSTDYRQSVSPWFRSVYLLQPDAAAMEQASWPFKLHALIGMALFALFPFTRLVHAFSAPIGYLFRPYLVYRSRTARR